MVCRHELIQSCAVHLPTNSRGGQQCARPDLEPMRKSISYLWNGAIRAPPLTMHHRLANGRMASIDSPYVHVGLHESRHRQALGLLQYEQAQMKLHSI